MQASALWEGCLEDLHLWDGTAGSALCRVPACMRTGTAGWDYDVQAQSIQARLLDLNSIMPGALRRLDMSRFAAATARLVGSSSACVLLLMCIYRDPNSDAGVIQLCQASLAGVMTTTQ